MTDRQTDEQTFVIVELLSWLKMLALLVFLFLVLVLVKSCLLVFPQGSLCSLWLLSMALIVSMASIVFIAILVSMVSWHVYDMDMTWAWQINISSTDLLPEQVHTTCHSISSDWHQVSWCRATPGSPWSCHQTPWSSPRMDPADLQMTFYCSLGLGCFYVILEVII